MPKLSKKQQTLQNLNVALSNTKGSAFTSAHFTTTDSSLYDNFLKAIGFSGDTVTQQSNYGGGATAYEGLLYQGGLFFAGVRADKKSFIIRYLGSVGFELLEKHCTTEAIYKILADFNPTLISYTYVCSSNEFNSTQHLLNASNTLSTINKTKTKIVFEQNGIINIGTRTNNFSAKIRGLTLNDPNSFSKLAVEVTLVSGGALMFVASLALKSSNLQNYAANSLLSGLKNLPSTQLLELIRGSITNNYSVGSVIKPALKSKASKFPAELKPVVASCTGIVNKLKMNVYTNNVKQILIDKLFSKIAESQADIENYEEFVKNINTALLKK